MWEKIKEWMRSEYSIWFFIGYFLCDFLDQLLLGHHLSAGIALAIVMANIWLLRNK